MNCSLEETGSISGNIIGRRSVTNTSYDVAHVTSILITRDGADLASITPYTSAQTMADTTNMKVSGDVNGNLVTKGYLTLAWTYVTDKEIGEFTCEVNAVSSTGHNIAFSRSLEVVVRNASTEDMKIFMNHLESRLTKQENDMNATIQRLEAEVRTKDKQIMDILTEVKKMQGGTINCGSSTSGWVNEGWWKTKTITTNFQQAYKTTPVVHLSFQLVNDNHQKDDDNEFGVELITVNQRSFTMKCKTWYGETIDGMTASWMSFPKF